MEFLNAAKIYIPFKIIKYKQTIPSHNKHPSTLTKLWKHLSAHCNGKSFIPRKGVYYKKKIDLLNSRKLVILNVIIFRCMNIVCFINPALYFPVIKDNLVKNKSWETWKLNNV